MPHDAAMSEGAPFLDSDWHPPEAQELATLLRRSRLVVLYCDAGAGTSELLRAGVLPLLQQGAGEPLLDDRRVSQVVIPFADRRSLGGRPAALPRDVVIFFDAWHEPLLAGLHARLCEALPAAAHEPMSPLEDCLAALHARLGVRFLFILDRFEGFLDASPDLDFLHEFVQAVNRPQLPAHFLIAVREDAKPLLKRLRRRIPGFDDHSLRLSLHEDGTLMLLPVLHDAALPARGPAAMPRPPMKTQQVYEAIETLLSKTAEPASEDPWLREASEAGLLDAPMPQQDGALHAPAHAAASPAIAQDVQADWTAVSLPPMRADAAGAQAPLQTRRVGLKRWALATIVVLPLLGLAWWSGQQWGRAHPDAPAGAAPWALPSGAASVKVEIAAADGGTDQRMVAELARQIAPAAGIDLGWLPSGNAADVMTRVPGVPRLAIALDDQLQAGRAAGDNGNALRIVLPLFAEEIHFIVRADSPLVFIHQIKGQRINVGPAQEPRARTAARLYETMFGSAPKVSPAASLPQDAALQQLLRRQGIDVIVAVDGQPAPWLAGLPAETARGIKLLKLDPRHPASRKALRAYLPATVRAGSYPRGAEQDTPSLAVMSFLVDSAAQDDAAADAISRFAVALCRALPALRRDGHPKWLEVQPGLQPQASWPYSPAAARGFNACLAGADASRR
jgi:hypothetical protein